MKTFKDLREASSVSSSNAQHTLGNDAEKKAHSALMQKKHGVKTTYHGSDELKYHGPQKNVKKALGTHYGGDHDHAKDDHPHIYKENVKTADRKPEIYTKPDGKKGTRMVPVDREVIKQEKTLEWLKASLAREAKKVKPRQDDMEEAYENTMYCKKCGCERGNPDPDCSCKMENASLTDSQCYSEQSKCGSLRKEDVNELTIADVQKATAMAKKRQEKEREAGKKSVSTTDLGARMPKKEDTDDPSIGRARNVKRYTHAAVDHRGHTMGFGRKPGTVSHAAVGKDGIPHGFANSHSDAKDLARLRNKRRPGSSSVVKLKHVELKKPISYAKADKHLGKSLKGHYHEATIPDGQTAMTKTPAMKDKDKKTMGKIADLMKRANESNVDEISKGMASRYIKKAQVSTADAAKSTERGYVDSRSPDRGIATAGKAQTRKGIKTFINRNKGTSTAVDKLTGKAKVPAKEGMAQGIVKQKISREKDMDSKRHDRMMDRARTSDTKKKNMERKG